MMENAIEDIISCFPNSLQNIIREIWTDGKIGISSLNMKLHQINTKVMLEESTNCKKNFVLEIPYAGKQLYWEIVFNDEDDSYAPDFEFTNDSFLSDPDPNIISQNIPTLANWNVKNPKSLVHVIRELLVLYRRLQLTTLQEKEIYSKLHEEYNALITNLGIPEENIEIYIEKSGFVHFLINICVNFSSLPPYIHPVLLGNNYNLLNPCEDTAALRVSFTRCDGSRFASDLQLSPRLEQVIGNSNSLHIPRYNKEKGLASYVMDITKLLTDRIEDISNHFNLRKEYIQVLLSRCGQSIIEYNNKLFTSATILCELEGFTLLVLINIGKQFPLEKPKVTLRSVYQLQNSKPIFYHLDLYPYSPRWTPQEMINRLLSTLNQELLKFQKTCLNMSDTERI